MYAQRDIHMVERLLDGNAALCTMHGKHFCDCYQIRDRCSWEWNVDSWISIPNLSLHVLYVLRVLLCLSPPLSPSLSLSLSLSLFFLSFCFFSFSVLREISHQGEQTVDLSRSFFRILDSPGHRATKNGCLSIRGPRNVRPRVTLASWKRKIKWNSLFVHEITSPVKYLFLSGPGETWWIF